MWGTFKVPPCKNYENYIFAPEIGDNYSGLVCPPLEILENPGFLFQSWKNLENPVILIYPVKTMETKLGIGSYLNYLTLSKNKDWRNIFCIIFNIVTTLLQVLITVLCTKNLSTSWGMCFVSFKYPWETPGKVWKKVLEEVLVFLNYEVYEPWCFFKAKECHCDIKKYLSSWKILKSLETGITVATVTCQYDGYFRLKVI